LFQIEYIYSITSITAQEGLNVWCEIWYIGLRKHFKASFTTLQIQTLCYIVRGDILKEQISSFKA
jgi:hypothetical protein